MTEYFEKNIFVHERDAESKLLPVDVKAEIKGIKGIIRVLPMLKGDIDEYANKTKKCQIMLKSKSADEVLKAKQELKQMEKDSILKYIINPQFTEEDIKFLKPTESTELVKAIQLGSGFEREKIEEMHKKLVEAKMKEMQDSGEEIPPK